MENLKDLVTPANFTPHFLGEHVPTLECVELPYTNDEDSPVAIAETGDDNDDPYNHTLVWKAEGHTFAITVTDKGYYVAYASANPIVKKTRHNEEVWTWYYPEQYVCHVEACFQSIAEIVERFENKLSKGKHYQKYTQYFQSEFIKWEFAHEAHTDFVMPHECHMNWPAVFADTGLIVKRSEPEAKFIAKHEDMMLIMSNGEYFAVVPTIKGWLRATLNRDNLFESNRLTVLSVSIDTTNMFIVFMDHEPVDNLPLSRNRYPIVVSSNLGKQLEKIAKGHYNAPRLTPYSMDSLMEFYAEMRK